MRVYRRMKMQSDGRPEPGMSMRTLGIRARDLHPRIDGTVDPQQGGLSVSPTIEALPRAARIKEDPLFELDTDHLSDELSYRADPDKPGEHGFIEPAYPMKYEHYQRLLYGSSELWTHV